MDHVPFPPGVLTKKFDRSDGDFNKAIDITALAYLLPHLRKVVGFSTDPPPDRSYVMMEIPDCVMKRSTVGIGWLAVVEIQINIDVLNLFTAGQSQTWAGTRSIGIFRTARRA